MNENKEVFTEEESIELSSNQEIRKKMIKGILDTASGLPELKEDKTFLLGLLDGADKSVMSRAKIRQEKKANDNNANAAKIVGDALLSINAKTYRPKATEEDRIVPEDLLHKDFVPGELSIGNGPIDIGK